MSFWSLHFFFSLVRARQHALGLHFIAKLRIKKLFYHYTTNTPRGASLGIKSLGTKKEYVQL
jgi:hypothetical protein